MLANILANSHIAYKSSGDFIQKERLFGPNNHLSRGDSLLLASTDASQHRITNHGISADLSEVQVQLSVSVRPPISI